MTVANLITLLRVVLVPMIVWSLLSNAMLSAFILFVLAGISDAVDGAVARYLNQQSAFGTMLDPIADKAMLVSVFVVLAYLGHIPLWLAIFVFSRDILIIVGVVLALLLIENVQIKPLWISKVNTTAQIVLASFVLGSLAFKIEIPIIWHILVWVTGLLTGLSTLAYIWSGLKLFAADEKKSNFDL